MLTCQLISSPINWTGPPTTISTSGLNSSSVYVSTDSSGNGLAMWNENTYVKARNISMSGVWSSITTLSGANASSHQMSVSPNGNCVAIWIESGAVKVATQSFGQSWSSATTLAASGGASPTVAIDAAGNILATWVAGTAIQSSTRLAGGSWQSTPDTLSSNGTNPRAAISANGTAIIAWHGMNAISSMDAIFAIEKTMNGSWGSAQTVSNPSQNSVFPKVAIDKDGNAVVLWFTFAMNGTQYTGVGVQSSTLLASTFSWSTPVNLDTMGNVDPKSLYLNIQFTSTGSGIAAWMNSIDGISYTLYSAVINVASGWKNVTGIVSDINLRSAGMGVTTIGDAFLTYMITDPATSNIVIQTLESYFGGLVNEIWINQQTVSTNSKNGYSKVSVSTQGNSNKNGVVAWITYDGTSNVIQAVTGNAPLIQPPTGLTATASVIDYNVFVDQTKTITWTSSTSPNTTLYLVYRNGIQIAQVDPSTPTFTDHNRTVGVVDTYGIAAIDGNTAEQSTIVTIAL